MNKGIVLLALGHAYWGRWAYNLALSIKFSNPELKITLLYAGDGKNQISDITLFDKMIEVPPELYTSHRGIEYLKVKTALYKLSPYKETIYLDADILLTPRRKLSELFEQFKDVDFTMANRGYVNLDENPADEFGVWCAPSDVKKAFGFTKGKYYNLTSEFIYFKKKKRVGKLFADAFKLYDTDKVSPNRLFNGGMPDELPFTIAMIKNDLYPHLDSFLPVYWEAASRPPLRLTGGDLNQYYAYSMGGHIAHPIMKKTYDNLVQFYCNQFNIAYPFKWINKRRWMPGRSSL